MGNAPVALFVYKRPTHTRRTLETLLANPEARLSPIYVFSDGPRTPADVSAVGQAREVVQSFRLPNLVLIERPENLGLARSVIAGVSQLCTQHGRAIVIEDDLVLAPTFLRYMNDALEAYRNDGNVYSVSGYMFPVDLSDLSEDAVFLPLGSSWGWATWDRAWRDFAPGEHSHALIAADPSLRARFDVGGYPFFAMLESQLRGGVDSWAIRWYATMFLRNALTLFPVRSLVTNAGFDGSGVHCGAQPPALAEASASRFRVTRFPRVNVHEEALRRVARVLARSAPRRRPVLDVLRAVAGRFRWSSERGTRE